MERADTFKFSTVIYLMLSVLTLPWFIVTLPLFWYLAYRSYKRGSPG